MECESRRVHNLHRRLMRITIGAFVLWNYIVYLRVRYATNKPKHLSCLDADMSYVFDA